jgi:hypothetical protein
MSEYTRLAYVNKKSEKEFEVILGNHVFGTSKADFDARFHVNAINDALQNAYEEGIIEGEVGLRE